MWCYRHKHHQCDYCYCSFHFIKLNMYKLLPILFLIPFLVVVTQCSIIVMRHLNLPETYSISQKPSLASYQRAHSVFNNYKPTYLATVYTSVDIPSIVTAMMVSDINKTPIILESRLNSHVQGLKNTSTTLSSLADWWDDVGMLSLNDTYKDIVVVTHQDIIKSTFGMLCGLDNSTLEDTYVKYACPIVVSATDNATIICTGWSSDVIDSDC
ncbi:hypothetical protein [Trichoplusia ni ascovirus 2c]|uniref:hypothetical protein n=1 Tax=Trichoplusia ni ascovirus 2c TaxID=328615 RepID=UPI0000E44219|nr:hypothetical protein TNAV2c_gp065 [Trichoplusia ni ascovirus 2c]ABF70582.1 hypothetical protein [Trichoplusia ni ascovirus 2c]